MSVSKIIRIMNRKKNILGILLCWCCFVSGYGQSQYGTFYVKFAGDSKSYSALRDTKDNNINPRIIESQRLFQNLTQKQIKGTRLNRKALSLHVGGALQSCYQVNFDGIDNEQENDSIFAMLSSIIRKTKCFRILERNAKISKTKRNFSRLYPTPQKFKKIDRLRRNEIHLKAVRTSS